MESKAQVTVRASLLLTIIQKLSKQYKNILHQFRRSRQLAIVEIVALSHEPGATQFLVHITQKNLYVKMTATEIINHGYRLHDFNKFHADVVRHATQGKLLDYLHSSDTEPAYKIVAKRLDRDSQQYLFTIRGAEKTLFTRSAVELSQDKDLLENLNIHDIYNIDDTAGSEAIVKEKTALLLAKKAQAH